MPRLTYPRNTQDLQERLERKAAKDPESHGDLAYWTVARGAMAADVHDFFELSCRRHNEKFDGSCHKLLTGKSLTAGCPRCRTSWLRERGRPAKFTFADEIEQELIEAGSNFRLADPSPRIVLVADYLEFRCLACEDLGLQRPTKRIKLSNMLTHVRSLPGQVACDGGCGMALKGLSRRVSYRVAAQRCPQGWTISEASYEKWTGPAKVMHQCGGHFTCTLRDLVANPKCSICSAELPSNKFRPADPDTLERWVHARSKGHLSTAGLYTDLQVQEINWKRDYISCVCVLHPLAERLKVRPKGIGKSRSEGCSDCLNDLKRKPRAYQVHEAREVAGRRGATVIKAQGYEDSEFMLAGRRFTPLELVQAYPMTRFGPMDEYTFKQALGSAALAVVKQFPAWRSAKTRDRLQMLARIVPAPVAAIAIGMSDREVNTLRVPVRAGGRIKFATPVGQPKSIWRHETFNQLKVLEASYWAGFIAADGCTTERKALVTVTLHIRDEDHLRRLMQFVESNGKLTYRLHAPDQLRVGGERASVGLYASLTITSAPISEALRKHWGIKGKKVTRPFTHVPARKSAQAAFLIGVIDGDGCASADGGTSIATVSRAAAGHLALVAEEVAALLGVKETHVRFAKYGRTWCVRICKRLTDSLRIFGRRHRLPLMSRKWSRYDRAV